MRGTRAPRGRLLLAGALLSCSTTAGSASTCTSQLDALANCNTRIAAQAACSSEQLLSNWTVRAILGCKASLLDCESRCLDALGLIGLKTNSTAPSCGLSEQLMSQHSASPSVVVTFLPGPSGLPAPKVLPGNLADPGSLPSFAYFGDYQGCMLGNGMQYCLVEGHINLGEFKANGLMGLCRPSSCSEQEIADTVQPLVSQMQMSQFEVKCHQLGVPAPAIIWTTGRTLAMVLFVVIALLIVLATRWDLRRRWQAEKLVPLDRAPLCAAEGPQAEPVGYSMLKAFSLARNGDSFSKVRPQDPAEPYMACLDGLRVLSTLWVILGHVVIWPLVSVQYDQNSMILPPKGRLTEFWFQIVPGGYFAVDTFFLLSGFLGAWTLQKKVKRSPQLLSPLGFMCKLYPMSLLQRWLRLSIVYAFVLLFTQTWYRPIGRAGPLWEANTASFGGGGCISSIDNEGCHRNWWTNLLYINTVVDHDKRSCMLWTWYLACDMQMFLTLPFFVLFRERGGKWLGWLLLSAGIIGSIVANCMTIWNEKLVSDPVLGSVGGGGKFMNDVYEVSWMRAQPYLIGIGYAWILDALWSRRAREIGASVGSASADQEAPRLAMAQVAPAPSRPAAEALLSAPTPKAPEVSMTGDSVAQSAASSGQETPSRLWRCKLVLLAVTLQLLSFAMMCFVVFIPVTRYRCESFMDCVNVNKTPWSPTFNMLYGGLNHAVWGLGLGCLLVLCFLKAPGTWWVNALLGADFWQGPAKLTYTAYLVHPLVLVLFYCQRVRSVQYLDSNLVSNFVAFAVIVFAVSFVVWLAVEKPAANLTAQLMGALGGGSRRGGDDA